MATAQRHSPAMTHRSSTSSNRMRRAGYKVSLVPFDFAQWEKNGPSTLERTSPSPHTWVEDTDYIVSQFSGGGDVTGAGVRGGPHRRASARRGRARRPAAATRRTSPACRTGAIALMQRGTCPFVQKYQNAQDEGAGAALIFNDGFEGREEPLFITAPQGMEIPAAMTSNDVGEEIYNQAQVRPGNAPRRGGRNHNADQAVQRDRRLAEGRSRPHDRARRAPRLGPGGTRHQRQRLRLVDAHRDRRAGGEAE